MATNFPGGIDTFVNPNATSSLDSPSHSGLHTDLGDAMTAVQTELVNNPYGLVHIETQTVTGTPSTISFNDVFSSTYDNYLLVSNLLTSASNAETLLRFRVLATDATTGYNRQTILAVTSWTFGTRIANDTATALFLSVDTGSNRNYTTCNIFNPNKTERTLIASRNEVTTSGLEITTGDLNNSTAYTGFTIFVNTGTITSGAISIYGYRK
jgi:hypothetical protein